MLAFTGSNKLLLMEDPCIFLLYNDLNPFLRNLMGKFVNIQDIKSASTLKEVRKRMSRAT